MWLRTDWRPNVMRLAIPVVISWRAILPVGLYNIFINNGDINYFCQLFMFVYSFSYCPLRLDVNQSEQHTTYKCVVSGNPAVYSVFSSQSVSSPPVNLRPTDPLTPNPFSIYAPLRSPLSSSWWFQLVFSSGCWLIYHSFPFFPLQGRKS